MKYYGLIIPSVFPAGVFIQDITQTVTSNEDEGINTVTVTLTNQQKAYFHVKNGRRGSAAEATAQMEKHAKEYIASELAEQKTALNQAINDSTTKIDTELQQKVSETDEKVKNLIHTNIEEAKRYIDSQLSASSEGLQNAIDIKVKDAMATTETKLLEKQNETIIKLLENGYVQWPGMPRPDTLFNFPGYRWAEIDYNGCFFRAKGSNANSFDGGEQGDAIRNIWGAMDTIFEDSHFAAAINGFYHADFGNGALYASRSSTWYTLLQKATLRSGYGSYLVFDASRYVPTAEENRPRNRTIIIWKLERI